MKTINLLILWFQLRALEATMYGQEEALTVVRDPETINRITLARINCRREWHRVRGRYLDMKRSRNVCNTKHFKTAYEKASQQLAEKAEEIDALQAMLTNAEGRNGRLQVALAASQAREQQLRDG